jgi:hypothetical protein
MSIKKIPRWHDQESTPEPASPFLSEELFTTAADSPEERTTGHTWYQSESPFLYAFDPEGQEAMLAQEAEAYEVDTDGEALAEDAVGELALEERFDPSAVPKDVADALGKKDWPLALKLAIQAGWRDENELTNLVFFARHPELPIETLDPKGPKFKQLSAEWAKILNEVVWKAIQVSAENTDLVVSGKEVADHHRFFWGKSGKRLKQLVEDAAREVDLNPGLLGAIMMAETRRPQSYLSSGKVRSYHIGADDFYEGRSAIEARVPAYAKVKWDKNQTPLVHDNDAKKPRKVKTILFDSGPDAVLATAVYVKFREVRLREIAAELQGDFDNLPLATRFALSRMAMAAGTAGATPFLKAALKGVDIFIRKAIRVQAYQTQRNATVRTAQAMHLSDWIFRNKLAPATQPEIEESEGWDKEQEGRYDFDPDLEGESGEDSEHESDLADEWKTDDEIGETGEETEEAEPEEEEFVEELEDAMEEPLRGAGDTREPTHLGLHEYQVAPPGQPIKVDVQGWNRSLSVPVVRVTAQVISDHSTIQGPGVHPLDFDRPVRLGVRAGARGQVGISLRIDYDGNSKPQYWSKVAQAHWPIRPVTLPFRCTPEGDITLERPVGRSSATFPGSTLSVDIEVYQRRDTPHNSYMLGIPPSVWDAWMKQLHMLRVVVIANLTVSQNQNDPGSLSVTVNNDSVPIPPPFVAGSTGARTARLGPMTVELEPVGATPPITAPQGIVYRVYFGVDSDQIDRIVKDGTGVSRHQGKALDAWIRDGLLDYEKHWDVRQALLQRKLPVRGEARASATLQGMSRTQLLRYNQELSEKRLAAVVNRLQRTVAGLERFIVLDTTQMKAIGASQARVLGEETVHERYCEIRIDGAELAKATKELYGRDFGGFNRKPGLMGPDVPSVPSTRP